MASKKGYWLKWWLGLDQWINTWFDGDEDETISSRLGKALVKNPDCRWCVYLCELLSRIDPAPGNHCTESIEPDEGEPLGKDDAS